MILLSGGPHESNKDGFDHVRFDLQLNEDDVKVIHVRYSWPTERKPGTVGVSVFLAA